MRRDRLMRNLLRERLLVTMTTGEAFEGLLYEADEKTVHLVSAFLVDPATRTQVDGSVFLPRDRIAYTQKPGEVTG